MIKSDIIPAIAFMALCVFVFYLSKRVEWVYRESKEKSDDPKDKYSMSWFEWEGKFKAYAILIIGIIFSIYLLFN